MLLPLIFYLIGCGEDVLKADNEFASSLLREKFPTGATFDQVNSVFRERCRNIELSRECDTESKVCVYAAIGVIPAPGDHWWLGKGDVQIYFQFNENKELESQFYEIYYPRLHQ